MRYCESSSKIKIKFRAEKNKLTENPASRSLQQTQSAGTLAVMLKKTKLNNMNFKVLNRIVSIFIIILNLYFVPFTLIQIYNTGGPMGFGLITIPITLIINLLLISAFLVFKRKYENSVLLLVLNSIASIFYFLLFILLITTPKMD